MYGFLQYEYVFIENDNVFNGNATIILHLHIVFVLFSAVYTKKVNTSGNPLFAFQDNLWLLLYRFQKLSFSVKTIIVFDRFRVNAR